MSDRLQLVGDAASRARARADQLRQTSARRVRVELVMLVDEAWTEVEAAVAAALGARIELDELVEMLGLEYRAARDRASMDADPRQKIREFHDPAVLVSAIKNS